MISKIKNHMIEMPFTDKRGNVYRYGEFFPVEFSPFAYNETLIHDQLPSNKESVELEGFVWRDPNRKVYETTIEASQLRQSIKDTSDEITKEIIACMSCKKAYRVHPNEFLFLKGQSLPIPRFCIDCRFMRRQKYMVPPILKHSQCMCAGNTSIGLVYKNTQLHPLHGNDECPNTFDTAYNTNSDIIYCEKCYQQEVY